MHGARAAVVDLDLVYEMFDPRRGPKNDDDLWDKARRVAGQLAAALLVEARYVIAEGDFSGEQGLNAFLAELPRAAEVRLVLLGVDLGTALKRTAADPSRGTSTDATFLAKHYSDFQAGWDGRDVLQLDTTESTLDETTREMLDWLAAES